MARVRNRNTEPERIVRSLFHRLGLRFRLHDSRLPGSPDLVLARHRTAVFVHGCFWHQHSCKRGTLPKTRVGFWREKLAKNAKRDRDVLGKLDLAGWKTMTIWQCELGDRGLLEKRIKDQFHITNAHDTNRR